MGNVIEKMLYQPFNGNIWLDIFLTAMLTVPA